MEIKWNIPHFLYILANLVITNRSIKKKWEVVKISMNSMNVGEQVEVEIKKNNDSLCLPYYPVNR